MADINDISGNVEKLDRIEILWTGGDRSKITMPFVNELLELTNTSMKFNGYFYLYPEVMPVHRILNIFNKNINEAKMYHVKITEMKKEDVPFRCPVCERGEECDPEENHIRFFADEIIAMKYEVLTEIQTSEYQKYVEDLIKTEEVDIKKRNEEAKRREEEKEMEFWRNYKYPEGYFDKIIKSDSKTPEHDKSQ
jgi:hypothetical protein